MAALAITVAVASKSGIAWVSGGRGFGADIAKVFCVATACGIVIALTRVGNP